jgi:acyl carrier protein
VELGEERHMTESDAVALLREGLSQVAPERAAALAQAPLSRPVKELGLDSLVLMELIGFLEDHTGGAFDEVELSRVKSLADLVRLLEPRTRAGSGER